jgi:hypothetical protein
MKFERLITSSAADFLMYCFLQLRFILFTKLDNVLLILLQGGKVFKGLKIICLPVHTLDESITPRQLRNTPERFHVNYLGYFAVVSDPKDL